MNPGLIEAPSTSTEWRNSESLSIAFGLALPQLSDMSDAEFIVSIAWEGPFAKRLSQAIRDDNATRVWELLLQIASAATASRRIMAKTPDKTSGKMTVSSAALWSRKQFDESTRAEQLVSAWANLATPIGKARTPNRNGAKSRTRSSRDVANFVSAIKAWLAEYDSTSLLSVLETLTLYEILRNAGHQLPLPLYGRLWRLGLTTALIRSKDFELPISAELDWQAGLLFSNVAGASHLRDSGRERLCRLLLSSTDTAGVPIAATLGELPIWATSLVRAREWGRHYRQSLLGPVEEKRFRGFLSAIGRLSRGDGTLALTNGQAQTLRPVWTAALASILDRVRETSPALQFLASVGAPTKTAKSKRNGRPKSNKSAKPERNRPVFQSDTSRLACLRSNWSPDSNSIVVAHDHRFPTIEFAARGSLLLAGNWEAALSVAGNRRPLDAAWTNACWYSDEDADYLELQTKLAGGVRVERQVLLARKDDFLFLADAVFGPADATIEYASRLPLVANGVAKMESGSSRCRLSTKRESVRVFPLELSTTPTTESSSRLTISNDKLELRQTGRGAFFAPLILDWNPVRRRATANWRSLTVAQNGVPVCPSVAVGYRLQVGKYQWLVYRSLARYLEPRSVLGHHTMCETVVGQFLPGGNVESIITVEQPAH